MRPHKQSTFNMAEGPGCGAEFGSLAIPVTALAVTVPRAAAILKPVLLLMDLRGKAAFRKSLGMMLVTLLASLGRVGAPIGALLFRRVGAPMVAGMAGCSPCCFRRSGGFFLPGVDSST